MDYFDWSFGKHDLEDLPWLSLSDYQKWTFGQVANLPFYSRLPHGTRALTDGDIANVIPDIVRSDKNPRKEDSTAACGCSIVNSFLSAELFSVSTNKIPHFVEFYLLKFVNGTLEFRFKIRSELLVGTWLCSLTNVKHVVRWTPSDHLDNRDYPKLSDSNLLKPKDYGVSEPIKF